MTRLTLEKPVSEMGAYELAHNCTFIKDGETWYRDFEKEISLREYIRRVALGHNVDLPTNDDELDEDLYFYLSYDPADSIEGILGVLNMLAWSHSELRAQLSEYENIGTIEQVKTAMNSPCDISEILEILDKMEFFGGQRAGRELNSAQVGQNFKNYFPTNWRIFQIPTSDQLGQKWGLHFSRSIS